MSTSNVKPSAFDKLPPELWEQIIMNETNAVQIREYAKMSKGVRSLLANESTGINYMKRQRKDIQPDVTRTWHQDLNGYLQGKFTARFADGRRINGFYTNGQPDGEWVYRNEEGQIFEIRQYQHGWLMTTYSNIPSELLIILTGGPNNCLNPWPTETMVDCRDVLKNNCNYLHIVWHNATVNPDTILPITEDLNLTLSTFNFLSRLVPMYIFDHNIQPPANMYHMKNVTVYYFGRPVRAIIRLDTGPHINICGKYKWHIAGDVAVEYITRGSRYIVDARYDEHQLAQFVDNKYVDTPLISSTTWVNGLITDKVIGKDVNTHNYVQKLTRNVETHFVTISNKSNNIDISYRLEPPYTMYEDNANIQRVEENIIYNGGVFGEFPPPGWVPPSTALVDLGQSSNSR